MLYVTWPLQMADCSNALHESLRLIDVRFDVGLIILNIDSCAELTDAATPLSTLVVHISPQHMYHPMDHCCRNRIRRVGKHYELAKANKFVRPL